MGYDFVKTGWVPEKFNEFSGRGGTTARMSFHALHGNKRYKVCDDESETTPQ